MGKDKGSGIGSIYYNRQREKWNAQYSEYDAEKDLALLKLDNIEVKSIKTSTNYNYGDKVYAIGNGSNYGISITEGIISNPNLVAKA